MATPVPSTRTVLVTGASRGIGRATAHAFAASGWRVVAGMRDPSGASGEPPGVHVVPLDVTEPASVRDAVREAQALAGGALACVVNNAGWTLVGAVEDVDLDLVRREFETNLFGAVAVMQASLPAMRRAGAGVLVGVSSLAGRIPLPLFSMYSASKLSLAAVLDALALELGPAGLRSVLIEAGLVRTDLPRSTVVSGAAGEAGSPYAGALTAVLGKLRAMREESGLEAGEVAAAIVRAVEDDSAPFRVVVADPGLGELTYGPGRGEGELHATVRRFFHLTPPRRGRGP
jgi:NAD(P)-dependent dehydrogenase (short-subunit alcohol dehydrogenase family)